jgi:hypothetical protein
MLTAVGNGTARERPSNIFVTVCIFTSDGEKRKRAGQLMQGRKNEPASERRECTDISLDQAF